MTASPHVFVSESIESDPGARWISTARTWQIIGALLAAVIIVSVGVLAGVSQYAGVRLALLQDAAVRSTRFESVFREGSEARLQALRLAAEITARDEPLLDALRRRDRTDLARRSVPMFEQVLKPRFNITVFDFPGIDGTMFFRAHRPDLFGDSVGDRAMVTATLKGRISVSGLDIGRSGPELRAMTPLVAGEAIIGALELGSSPWEALQSAAQATGLDFGFAMDRRIAESLDRPRGSTDFIRGDALYIRYARPEVRDLLDGVPFDPLDAAPQLLHGKGYEAFVRTLPVLDVGRKPVTRVTLVEDLTDTLAARRMSIILTTTIAVAVILAVALVGLFQFQALKARVERSFSGRLKEVRSKASAYDRVSQSLRDVQAWKLGLVGELALLIRDPLASVQAIVERAAQRDGGSDQALVHAANEIRRLGAAVDGQVTMLTLRDRLRHVEAEAVDLVALSAAVSGEIGGPAIVQVAIPSTLPRVRSNAPLLRAALRAVLQSLKHRSDAVSVTIDAHLDGTAVVGRITGAGAWRGSAPVLDEASAFGSSTSQDSSPSLILARITLEHFGGTLTFQDGDAKLAGFAFSLAVA